MSTRAAGPAIGLSTGVGYLKGVGPHRADLLRTPGIIVARDLLFHVPHRSEHASTIPRITSADPGGDAPGPCTPPPTRAPPTPKAAPL